MQNRLYNGEMQAKSPAGLPPRNPENMIPRGGAVEQDWWLRNNDRARHKTDGAFTYFNSSPLKKKTFQVGSLEKDHPRRVFKQLAHQGHSFSEANLQALQQDREIRKTMQRRYWEVMRTPAGPPPPTKPFLRSASQPASSTTPQNVEAAAAMPPARSSTQRAGRATGLPQVATSPAEVGSSLSACHPLASQLSAAAPAEFSRLSAAAPAASRLSAATASQLRARLPMSGSDAEGGAVNVQEAASGVEASALSVSDFYAWRPRLLR